MSTDGCSRPSDLDVATTEEQRRRRNAWTELGVHVAAFVALLVGFIARVRYVEAEGVRVDPVVIVLAAVITVVAIIALSIALTFARHLRLRKAVAAAGVDGVTVFGYWSRINTVPFLADPNAMPGRGTDVAVTATTGGLRLRALRRRRLADFGLIPWSSVVAIDGARRTVGVRVVAKSGVITLRTQPPIAPYAQVIELFPAGQSSAEAAERLRSVGLPTPR